MEKSRQDFESTKISFGCETNGRLHYEWFRNNSSELKLNMLNGDEIWEEGVAETCGKDC